MTETATPADAPRPLPKPGALLGVDFGTRRIGIAICNAEQTLAVPLETWINRTPELDGKHFCELVANYRIQGIVLGLPLMNRSGDEGKQAKLTRKFGAWLQTVSGIPLVYWDERYSTAEAEALLWSLGEKPGKSNKARLDGLAAQVILQSYLDQQALPGAS